MSARPTRSWRWLIALALVGGATWLVLFPSRERRVRATLTSAAESIKHHPGEDARVRRERIERELSNLLAPDARVAIPGIAIGPGRAAVITRLLELTDAREPVVQLDHIEVRFERDAHASAHFDAIVSDSQAGDLHGDARRVTAELEKRGSDWVISSVSASPEERAQPEARP